MKESFTISDILPASKEVIYSAWLDSDKHTEMTGGEATCSDQVGGDFSAWDGYITGKNVALLKNEEIVQTWRTTEFAENDEDSLLTIKLKEVDGGTEITLVHTNIPEGQTQYKQGWIDHYFVPMKAYFV